tara:strand:+ start:308 stop:562 length:255 start_codon:yes stop_codon:yes gene_type:complete
MNVEDLQFTRDKDQDIWRTYLNIGSYKMMIGWSKFGNDYIITITEDNKMVNIENVNPGPMITSGLSKEVCNKRIENMYAYVNEQ